MMIRRLALITGFVILNAFGFAAGARAGEGAVAGSAAFTITPTSAGATTGLVTGVAVSAAVGKSNAAAQAFNYAVGTSSNLQNSAFAIGTAGTLTNTLVGNNSGTVTGGIATTEAVQNNTITKGYTIQLGTASGNSVITSPAPAPAPAPAP